MYPIMYCSTIPAKHAKSHIVLHPPHTGTYKWPARLIIVSWILYSAQIVGVYSLLPDLHNLGSESVANTEHMRI